MDHELWRQWQALAALWQPASPDSQAYFGRDGAFGFTPIKEVAERFSAAARSFLDSAANASAPAAGQAAAAAFSDFLREQFADFQLPGSPGFGAGHNAGSAFTGDPPAFGASREHQQRWQRMAEASRRMANAQHRLQRLWSDALREAAAAYAARLVPPQPAAVSAQALRELYDGWIDRAEDAYARMAHSEAFCNALADYVNASSEWRRELQASIEQWAKLLDLPTRSEINTLMQRLRGVEELLRAARKQPKPRKKASRARPAPRKVSSRRKARP